ncbi:MAG: hypothetical protein AAFV01_09090, partial [Bacteroidota bacterium]
MLEAETFGEAVDALRVNPAGVAAEVVLGSAPSAVPSLVAAGAGGLAGGPAGAAIAGGTASGATDYSANFLAALEAEGIDPTDPDALAQAIAADPARVMRAHARAREGATIIGAADAASMGVAGKILVPGRTVARRLGNAATQATAGGTLGMVGEAARQQVVDGELRPGEVLAEGLGELAQAPVEMIAANARALGAPEAAEASVATETPTRSDEAAVVQENATGEAEGLVDNPPHAAGAVVPDAVVRLTRRAANRTRASLRSRGDLPQPAYDASTAAEGEESALVKRTAATLADFDRAVREGYSTKADELDAETRTALDEAVRTGQGLDSLPPSVQPVVVAMRRQAEALSRRLVRAGVLDGTAEAALDANGGALIRPRFRAGSDPDWATTVPDDVKNRARALLASKYPDRTPAEIDGLMGAMLDGEASSPLRHLTAQRIAPKRIQQAASAPLPSVLRAYLGESNDARASYAAAMAELGSLASERDFFDQVRQAGETDGDGRFLYDQPTQGPDGTLYTTPVDKLGTTVGAPLRGLYTTPEIARALGEVESPRASRIPALILQATAGVKFGKTVLSPLTQVRNVLGNVGFAVMQGHLGRDTPRAAVEAAKTTWSELQKGRGSGEKRRAYAERLARLGVLDESVRAGDLAGIFADAGLIARGAVSLPNQSTSIGAKAKQAGRISVEVATRLYQAGDAAWKVYAFEMERARYARALPQASAQALDRIAARVVRDTYPTYSKVPQAVQKLRRLPFFGPFVSFPAEVFRTTYHTLRLVRDDLADPRRRTIGLQRAAGVLAQAAVTGAAATGALAFSGLTEDDERDARRLLPSWDRNSPLVFWKDGTGQPGSTEDLRYTNLGYTDPHAILREPVIAVVRGIEGDDTLSDTDLLRLSLDATKPLLAPFTSEDILAGRILDVLRNRDEYGREVYDADRPEAWTEAVLAHLYEGIEPGLLQQARRLQTATEDQGTRLGRKYALADEARAYLTGSRPQTLDVRRGF